MKSSNGDCRAALVVGALGVVYGDIGTSPLYALRECFNPAHGVPPVPGNILGVVSLMVWTLILMVTIKYLWLVLRADNKGEGGILALLSLAVPEPGKQPRWRTRALLGLGVFGAALLYGDGIITPAMTVLGAVEGLEVVTPVFTPYVAPASLLILIGLFSMQRLGTGKVGSVFGPIMLVWFSVLGVLGMWGILQAPQIFQALSPHYALGFLWQHGHAALLVLGSVFLVATGAEALYADMGHFGAGPIRRAWFRVAFPGLLLNYFGEGALLMIKPEAAANPFFFLAPRWALLPLVGLAALAAVIASQALISGVYSLTMQAIQMGYLPRLNIQHTSRTERGQIYMPQINTALMLACLGLVLGFQSSSRLAGAYGIAVSMTMLITTLLLFAVARRRWHWSWPQAALVCGCFIALELAFLLANGLKLLQGGWFPLLVGLGLFLLMSTWKKGRQALASRLAQTFLPFETFLKDMDTSGLHRVPGTAVFLSGNVTGTPLALLHNIRHNKVLHERVVILTILTEDVPYLNPTERVRVERLRPDIYRVIGAYGFMEQPDVPGLLSACASQGLALNEQNTTFFLSRETIMSRRGSKLSLWRRRLFAAMSRNAQSATAFFQIPPNRVVELGMQVEI